MTVEPHPLFGYPIGQRTHQKAKGPTVRKLSAAARVAVWKLYNQHAWPVQKIALLFEVGEDAIRDCGLRYQRPPKPGRELVN